MDVFEKTVIETTRSGIAPLSMGYIGIYNGYAEFPIAYRGEASVFTTATGVVERAADKAEGTATGVKLSIRAAVHAIRLMRELIDRDSPVKIVFVKACASLFYENELSETLSSVISAEDLASPEKICLEFSAAALGGALGNAEGVEALKRGFSEIKAAGFTAAISGVSDKFPFALLADIKPDHVFLSPEITAMSQDRTKKGVLEAIIALMHTIGVKVIAEGVESDEAIRDLISVEAFGFIPSEGYTGGYVFQKGVMSDAEVLEEAEGV